MDNNNRQKILIIIVAGIVGLLLLNTLLLSPLKGTWEARQKRIDELKHIVLADKHLINRRTEITGKWERMKNNVLPSNPSKADSTILKAKDRWEQESGIKVDSFSPQMRTDEDPNSKETITTLECRADATGSMRNVLRFLWAIENDPMGLKLEDVELSSKDNTGQQISVGLTMSGLILDLPQSDPQTNNMHP